MFGQRMCQDYSNLTANEMKAYMLGAKLDYYLKVYKISDLHHIQRCCIHRQRQRHF